MSVLLWPLNGGLALAYLVADYLGAVLLLPAAGLLFRQAKGLWLWTLGALGLALAATLVVPPPVPLVIPAMAWAAVAAVRLERFNPEALFWQAIGGLALYAATALALTAYTRYAASLDAAAWAATFAEGEAGQLFASGRPYLATAATLALWLVGPAGYFTLLFRTLLVHPPAAIPPGELLTAIRTGHHDRTRR